MEQFSYLGLGGDGPASIGPKSTVGERLDVKLHGGSFSRLSVIDLALEGVIL